MQPTRLTRDTSISHTKSKLLTFFGQTFELDAVLIYACKLNYNRRYCTTKQNAGMSYDWLGPVLDNRVFYPVKNITTLILANNRQLKK